MNSSINSSILAAVLLLLTGCGTPPEQTVPEQCSNSVDDDRNGFADCADTACVADPACVDEPLTCASQEECLGGHSYDYFTRGLDLPDGGAGVLRPIPMCSEQTCVTPDGQISIRLDLKTDSYSGYPKSINAVNTRFVKKIAVDGSAVTCANLTEVAGSNTAAANAIEASKRFNLQAYDAVSTNGPVTGGSAIPVFMYANVGADFIIWVELWSQKLDSNTRLPTGQRYGYTCVESGAQVAELTAADHNVRAISLLMPAPQNP